MASGGAGHPIAVSPPAWLDTGLDADAVEFCPRAGHSRWTVAGTYKLRESDAGGKAHQQTRDGELILVDVTSEQRAADDGGVGAVADTSVVTAHEVSRLAVSGVFDIKWSGAIGTHSPSVLGHAAADGTLRVYSLTCADETDTPPEADGDDGMCGHSTISALRPRAAHLTETARINCASDGIVCGRNGDSGVDETSRGGEGTEGTSAATGSTTSALSLALAWDDTFAHSASPTAAVSMSDGTASRSSCPCLVAPAHVLVIS
jgi:hypothetical protein